MSTNCSDSCDQFQQIEKQFKSLYIDCVFNPANNPTGWCQKRLEEIKERVEVFSNLCRNDIKKGKSYCKKDL